MIGPTREQLLTDVEQASIFAKSTHAKDLDKSCLRNPCFICSKNWCLELKLNNPQLSSLREAYLSAKATVPQIAAPSNPQVGLVWSGMPVNSPFALGGANAPSAANP